MTIYERALEFIKPGMVVGLGSGRASTEFIKLLGTRFQSGLAIRGGVPTSDASAELAKSYGIPILSLAEGMPIDVAVDGADEWTEDLDLIKGYGRALVREKIVEAASKFFIVLVGPNKKVTTLGQKGKLPVEVIPLALPLVQSRLRKLGWDPVPWSEAGVLKKTDNGNPILDCKIPSDSLIRQPSAVDRAIMEIPGVVGTGIFSGMADLLLEGDDGFAMVKEWRI